MIMQSLPHDRPYIPLRLCKFRQLSECLGNGCFTEVHVCAWVLFGRCNVIHRDIDRKEERYGPEVEPDFSAYKAKSVAMRTKSSDIASRVNLLPSLLEILKENLSLLNMATPW